MKTKDKLKDAFDVLQDLDVKATPHNVGILAAVFNTLREVYAEMEATERRETDGPEADPGGRSEN